MLRADTAALTAVCTTSGYMESTDDMEHIFLKSICICFRSNAGFCIVEYTGTAAACRTYVAAGITADTFGKLASPEFKTFLCTHGLQFCNHIKTVITVWNFRRFFIRNQEFVKRFMLFSLADFTSLKKHVTSFTFFFTVKCFHFHSITFLGDI